MGGSFNKKTIKDIDVSGKRVLLRADYNVPLVSGKVVEDYRLRATVPTIKYLLEQGCKGLVIIAHNGRPDGKRDQRFSLAPVARRMSRLLKHKVEFANDCLGDDVEKVCSNLKSGNIILLENLRFYSGEESNDPSFAQKLVKTTGADVFVQDGFGVVHRKHASTDAITKLLPSVAGLLLEKEVITIGQTINDPKRPLMALVGGAKIADKIGALKKFIEITDCVAVAGAMANNFLLAQRISIGESMVDKESVTMAKEIIELASKAQRQRKFNLLLPVDSVVSLSDDGSKPTRVVDFTSGLADISAYPKKPIAESHTIAPAEKILDIGPATAAQIAGAIKVSQTVIWNGTCGVTETVGIAGAAAPFSHGTKAVVRAMIGTSRQHMNKPYTLVGGGDTSSYLEQQKLVNEFDFVSTGGGASLELMAGEKLPGIEALQTK